MPPSVVVPLGRPSTHHLQNTAFSRPSASQGSEHTAVVPSAPLPFPVAIPLGVPRILPSRETPYCVHVEEKAVESEGIRSENPPPPKVSDACQQTSDVLVLDYAPQPSGAMATQLVVEVCRIACFLFVPFPLILRNVIRISLPRGVFACFSLPRVHFQFQCIRLTLHTSVCVSAKHVLVCACGYVT